MTEPTPPDPVPLYGTPPIDAPGRRQTAVRRLYRAGALVVAAVTLAVVVFGGPQGHDYAISAALGLASVALLVATGVLAAHLIMGLRTGRRRWWGRVLSPPAVVLGGWAFVWATGHDERTRSSDGTSSPLAQLLLLVTMLGVFTGLAGVIGSWWPRRPAVDAPAPANEKLDG